MFRLVALLLSCLFVVTVDAAAQTANPTVHDGRVWFVGVVQDRVKKDSRWRWQVENILRSREGLSELDTYGLRPSLSYALTSRSSVGGGYGFAAQPSAADDSVSIEHRLFQQYSWSGAVGGGTLAMRARIEQRFYEGNSGVQHRFRQQVRYGHAIRKGSAISVIGYDELFVNVNETSRYPNGIEQNRIFGGLSYAINPRARVEGGYLNQYTLGHGRSARMNHVFSTSLNVSLH